MVLQSELQHEANKVAEGATFFATGVKAAAHTLKEVTPMQSSQILPQPTAAGTLTEENECVRLLHLPANQQISSTNFQE